MTVVRFARGGQPGNRRVVMELTRSGRELAVRVPTPVELDGWMRTLLHATIDYAVVFSDLTGTIVGWKGAAANMFGYTDLEAIGRPVHMLSLPEDVHSGLDQDELESVIAAGRLNTERWRKRRDGRPFWSSGILRVITDVEGKAVAVGIVIRDTTEDKMKLDRCAELLKSQAVEMRMRFTTLAEIAHELRNLVAPITASISLLRRWAGDDPKILRQFAVLDVQLPAVGRMLDDFDGVTSELLRTPQLKVSTVQLQEAVQSAVSALEPQALERRQKLSMVLSGAPIFVSADSVRLAQMLSNIIGNAIKYTPPGGNIHVCASIENGLSLVTVEDDGTGISEQALPHIFELFTRDARQTGSRGLGIGLAIVKQYAAMHGGSVEAHSKGAGRGAVFKLRLPMSSQQ